MPGAYTITYTASKGCGELDTAVRTVTVEPDTTNRPVFASATLNKTSGNMIITFDRTIRVAATDLTRMSVHEAGGGVNVLLQDAEFDRMSPNSDTIYVTFSHEKLGLIILMHSPQLDIGSGAVEDLEGNAINASLNNAITVTTCKPPVGRG